MNGRTPARPRTASLNDKGERGAALVLALLISFLLLSAGAALLMVTAFSGTRTSAASAEMQAYYAAEAGIQGVLSVLRGHRAPNPLFVTNPSGGGIAPQNKITFRKAITRSDSNLAGDPATISAGVPFPIRLSRWLPYNFQPPGLTYPDRVTLTPNYSPLTGMAYSASLTDPDSMSVVVFTTTGVFPTSTSSPQTSITQGSGSSWVRVAYTPPSSGAAVTVTNTGTLTLGSFAVTTGNNPNQTFTNVAFNLTISQRAPYPATTSSPITLTVNCRLEGQVTSTTNTLRITVVPPASNPTSTSHNISGVLYERTSNSYPLSLTASTSIPVVVTSPEPRRLLVHVTGYGPQGAIRHMKMLVNRFSLDMEAAAAVTLRGSDDASPPAMFFEIGNSSQYAYSGNDNAGGANLPGFCVTNTADFNKATTVISGSGSGQVTGTSAVRQVSPATLPSFLHNTENARAFLQEQREEAQDTGRYFTTANPPSDFGATTPNGLLTFVDGDATLPPAGGAGMLIVTGKLDMRGSAIFRGIVLVLGGGTVERNGGGNGETLGTMFVAKFGASGGFQPVHFDSNGGGTADLFYDSRWVERALLSGGPRIVGISEY